MINIVSDLPVTFVGYEFDIDNVRNIMSSYVFTMVGQSRNQFLHGGRTQMLVRS